MRAEIRGVEVRYTVERGLEVEDVVTQERIIAYAQPLVMVGANPCLVIEEYVRTHGGEVIEPCSEAEIEAGIERVK